MLASSYDLILPMTEYLPQTINSVHVMSFKLIDLLSAPAWLGLGRSRVVGGGPWKRCIDNAVSGSLWGPLQTPSAIAIQRI